MRVRVEFLGGLRVTVDGRHVTRFRTLKTAHVVAILALQPGVPVRRDVLIEWLWPGAASALALNSLSQALAALRRDLGDALRSDRQTVSLDADTDVAEFRRAADAVDRASPDEAPSRAREALAIVRGPFLPGVLEPWAVHERLRVADRAQEVLDRWRAACDSLSARLEAARMATVLDPTSESAATDVIELLFEAGKPREAEAEFRRLQGRMLSELGMKPSAGLSRLVLERVRLSAPSVWWVMSHDREPESCASAEAALARGRRLARNGLPVQIAREAGPVEVVEPGVHWRAGDTDALSIAIGSSRMVAASPGFVRLVEPPRGGALPRLGSLVGRESLLDRAFEALAGTRLLTLVGPGGNGKTRLAIALGERAQTEGERVVWVGLSEVRAADRVLKALADALGSGGEANLDAIVVELDGPTVLILDNLEQIDGDLPAVLDPMLARLPQLRIVATSRRRLGTDEEYAVEVPPLDGGSGEDVALFRLRSSPPLGTDESTVAHVREICEALGGSPLAIELVAARTAVLSLADIAARLDGVLDWPHRQRRPGERQHTLRSTVEWSLALLDDGTRRALAALALLDGSASTELLTELTADRATPDHLLVLREASLVVSEGGSTPRANLLDTIRAVVRTTPLGGEEGFPTRLVAWAVGFAEAQAARLQGPEQMDALDRLSIEHEHLRRALAVAIDTGSEEALRLVCALWRFWHLRSHLAEGATWVRQALDAVPESVHRPSALNGLGRLKYLQGDYEAAERAHREALQLDPNDDARALALNGLGAVAYERGAYDAALVAFDQALAIRVALGDGFGEGNALNWIGLTLADAGRLSEAVEALERSLTVRRAIGDESGIARSLGWLGTVARRQGDAARAENLYREALATHTRLGDRRGQAGLLGNLGLVARDADDTSAALALFEESEAIHAEIGDRWGVATMLFERGRLLVELDRVAEGRESLERSRALREAMGNLAGVAEVLAALGLDRPSRYIRP